MLSQMVSDQIHKWMAHLEKMTEYLVDRHQQQQGCPVTMIQAEMQYILVFAKCSLASLLGKPFPLVVFHPFYVVFQTLLPAVAGCCPFFAATPLGCSQ